MSSTTESLPFLPLTDSYLRNPPYEFKPILSADWTPVFTNHRINPHAAAILESDAKQQMADEISSECRELHGETQYANYASCRKFFEELWPGEKYDFEDVDPVYTYIFEEYFTVQKAARHLIDDHFDVIKSKNPDITAEGILTGYQEDFSRSLATARKAPSVEAAISEFKDISTSQAVSDRSNSMKIIAILNSLVRDNLVVGDENEENIPEALTKLLRKSKGSGDVHSETAVPNEDALGVAQLNPTEEAQVVPTKETTGSTLLQDTIEALQNLSSTDEPLLPTLPPNPDSDSEDDDLRLMQTLMLEQKRAREAYEARSSLNWGSFTKELKAGMNRIIWGNSSPVQSVRDGDEERFKEYDENEDGEDGVLVEAEDENEGMGEVVEKGWILM